MWTAEGAGFEDTAVAMVAGAVVGVLMGAVVAVVTVFVSVFVFIDSDFTIFTFLLAICNL